MRHCRSISPEQRHDGMAGQRERRSRGAAARVDKPCGRLADRTNEALCDTGGIGIKAGIVRRLEQISKSPLFTVLFNLRPAPSAGQRNGETLAPSRGGVLAQRTRAYRAKSAARMVPLLPAANGRVCARGSV